MILRAENRTSETKTAMRGGPGAVRLSPLVTPAELQNKGRMYAALTLEPGCGIGPHDHQKETEIYYVLRGTADYSDNGTVRRLGPGDVAVCPPGESHGIVNSGTETVELTALILYA